MRVQSEEDDQANGFVVCDFGRILQNITPLRAFRVFFIKQARLRTDFTFFSPFIKLA